ncbi:TPA: SAM-dependent DNA methyltransferase [Legionella bozemanae]|uniref:SAM-dependent DNA methyltransferase n=1 Tax=Legionella bozemanae TaxID=447 RepID=UPI00399C74DA
MDLQIKSKKRVVDHGEVFTSEREVNAMLNLIKQETDRIESRLLEPACGTGNFLVEVLHRKLNVVKARYRKSKLEYERYAILAISSIYGIDVLEDNVIYCQKRLFNYFDEQYTKLYGEDCSQACRNSARFILERNILWGDALTMKTCEKEEPIVFSEWSAVNGSMLKRRDYSLAHLLECQSMDSSDICSDLPRSAFIPKPIKEFPLMHFLRLDQNV